LRESSGSLPSFTRGLPSSADAKSATPPDQPAAADRAVVPRMAPRMVPAADAKVDAVPLPSSAAFPVALGTAAVVASSVAPVASAKVGQLGAEARALRQAQEALDAGRAAVALALLDEQRVTFARGVLADERAAARIFALCALGRRDEAARETERFL